MTDLSPLDLDARIERLDALLAQQVGNPRGLGLRLALGMTCELRDGRPLGSVTGDLVASWVRQFGEEVVDDVVDQARALLLDPAGMRRAIEARLPRIDPSELP